MCHPQGWSKHFLGWSLCRPNCASLTPGQDSALSLQGVSFTPGQGTDFLLPLLSSPGVRRQGGPAVARGPAGSLPQAALLPCLPSGAQFPPHIPPHSGAPKPVPCGAAPCPPFQSLERARQGSWAPGGCTLGLLPLESSCVHTRTRTHTHTQAEAPRAPVR